MLKKVCANDADADLVAKVRAILYALVNCARTNVRGIASLIFDVVSWQYTVLAGTYCLLRYVENCEGRSFGKGSLRIVYCTSQRGRMVVDRRTGDGTFFPCPQAAGAPPSSSRPAPPPPTPCPPSLLWHPSPPLPAPLPIPLPVTCPSDQPGAGSERAHGEPKRVALRRHQPHQDHRGGPLPPGRDTAAVHGPCHPGCVSHTVPFAASLPRPCPVRQIDPTLHQLPFPL